MPQDAPLFAQWRGLLAVWIVPGGLLGFGIAVWLVIANQLAPPVSGHVGRIFVAVTGAVALIAGIAGAATALGAEVLRRIAPGRVRVFAVHLALGAGFWPAWICLETSRMVRSPAAESLLRGSMLVCLVLVPPATYLAARRWTPRGPGPVGLSLATAGVALLGLAFLTLVTAMPGATRPADTSGVPTGPVSLAPAFESLPGGLVAEPPPGRLIVIAVDGLPPALLQRVIDTGDAPHLAGLRREGAWGELASMRPTASPLIWTSVATGRVPEEHGVTSFTTWRYPRLGIDGLERIGPLEFARPVLDRIDPLRRIPISSRSRKVKALWNLCSEAGISVGVVGWWASWPAEEVEGFVVSDHAYFQQRRMGKLAESRSSEAPSSYTWPPAALDALRSYQRDDLDDATPEVLDPFVQLEPGDRVDFQERIAASNLPGRTLRWLTFSVLKDRFYAQSALRLKQQFRPQVLMVYLQSVDQFAHLIWHYTVPEAATLGYDPRDLERYRHGMHRVVASLDDWIGQLIADRDEHTTVVVLSDHGWARTEDRDGRPTYGHAQAPPGVFVAAGPGIAPVGRVDGARILDVTPTLLYLLGLPVSDELPGRILDEILDPARRAAVRPRAIASYEVGPPLLRAPAASAEDDAMIENLRALGYVE